MVRFCVWAYPERSCCNPRLSIVAGIRFALLLPRFIWPNPLSHSPVVKAQSAFVYRSKTLAASPVAYTRWRIVKREFSNIIPPVRSSGWQKYAEKSCKTGLRLSQKSVPEPKPPGSRHRLRCNSLIGIYGTRRDSELSRNTWKTLFSFDNDTFTRKASAARSPRVMKL